MTERQTADGDGQRRRTARFRRQSAIWLLAPVVVFALWTLWPQPDSLPRIGTAVPVPFGSQYHWRSDNELVVLVPEASGQGYTSGRAEIIDARTGKRSVAARYKMPGGSWARWDFGSVSPDGRWALWLGEDANWSRPAPCRIGAISLTGEKDVTWPAQPWMIGAAWSRDSRSVLLGTFPINSRAASSKASLQALPVAGTEAPPLKLASGVNGYSQSGVFGTLPNGRALLWAGDARFHEADLRTGAVTDFDLSSAIPPWDSVEQCEPSPKCERLAWVTSHDKLGPAGGWLEEAEWRLGLRMERTRIWALFVTNLNGLDRHQIGTWTSRAGAVSQPIVTLRWLPSGKRLSFVHGTTLYTVPVE